MANTTTPMRNAGTSHSGTCQSGTGQFGTEIKERAQDLANTAAEKGKEVAAGVVEKAKDVAGTAAKTASEFASTVGHKAEDAACAVGGSMKSLAGNIRENLPREGAIGTASSAVADTLESSGRYLQEEGFSGMAEDLTNMIRRNPIPALLLGIGIGFLLARSTRS